MNVKDALNQIWNTSKRHAIVMAPGGAGKSCLVKDLACDTDGSLPIYIDLSTASGEHYIFSTILREYVGNTSEYDDVTAKKALMDLFTTESAGSPAYRLILDGIDDADKSTNQGLHTEINELSKCSSLQIVITVRTIDFLKTNYYFDQLKAYSLLSLQLLSENQRDSALKDRGLSSDNIAPEFLDILRRPMFLSVFLDLASDSKEGYNNQLTSARDLFSAIVSRDIDKQASQDGLYDKAEYAFHYLLPCLANTLNRVSFTAEELKKALYKSYLDTSYKCGAFDGISTDVISRAKQNYGSAEFPEFRQFISDEIYQKYVAKIFIPRGYIIKTGTTGFRFSHRNWLQYFQMEHWFNLMHRYDEDPSLSEIPALLASQLGQKKNAPYSREELSELILSAWESETDDSAVEKTQKTKSYMGKTVKIIGGCAAGLILIIGLAFFISRLSQHNDTSSEPSSDHVEETSEIRENSNNHQSANTNDNFEKYIEFVLTGGDLTVDDFSEAAVIVHDRLDILADGREYDFSNDNYGIHFSLPESVFHGEDPLLIIESYISRPIHLFLMDLSSFSINNGYKNIYIPRESIESVQIKYGTIDGADPADYDYEGDSYPYIEVTLTPEFMESCSGTFDDWKKVVFAQDIIHNNVFPFFYTFPQPDGRTFCLINTDFSENFLKTQVFNYTHKPTASELTISYEPPVEWEDPASVIRPGRYQVSNTAISEDSVIIEYSTHAADTGSGTWIDTLYELKKRLDTIKQPYAIGTLVVEERVHIQVKTELSKLGPYLPEMANLISASSFDETGFMVCGLKSLRSEAGLILSTFFPTVETEDDGSYSLHIRLYPKTDMTFHEYASKVCTEDHNELLLYLANYPLLTAAGEDIADDYEIAFRHIYGASNEPIGEEDKWILDLVSEIISNDPLPLDLSLYKIITDPRDLMGNLVSDSIYASEKQKIRDAIIAAVPSASVKFNNTNDIIVNLDIYVDEDIVSTGIEQARMIYTASGLEDSHFTGLYIRLIPVEYLMGEQASIYFQKSRLFGEVCMLTTFQNGRMDKYKNRFYEAITNDPFFSSFNIVDDYFDSMF